MTYELEMERQDEGARPRGRCEAVEGEALGMGVQAMCLMVPLVIIGGESEGAGQLRDVRVTAEGSPERAQMRDVGKVGRLF